jgi:MFS family permease
MLPATLVVPAIRPLFASLHDNNVSAMHAFMSINMAAAVLTAPWIGRLADRTARPGRAIAVLTLADAVLLAIIAMPLPLPLVLTLRALEGAAHVGASTMLMHEAARRARVAREGKTMGLAGAAIIFAIAAGNALGGATVTLDPFVPFAAAAAIAGAVSLSATRIAPSAAAPPETASASFRWRDVAVPVSAAFIERFAVGCIVVSFALFAHSIHQLSDAQVGMHFFALTFTFGIAVAPLGRLADRISRSALLAAGALLYGTSLIAIAFLPRQALLPAMIAAGIAAAMMFVPALASVAAGSRHRGAAMALFNAAGCLGMMLGPIISGIVIAAARDVGARAYAAPSIVAGCASLLWVLSAFVATRFRRATHRGHHLDRDRPLQAAVSQ